MIHCEGVFNQRLVNFIYMDEIKIKPLFDKKLKELNVRSQFIKNLSLNPVVPPSIQINSLNDEENWHNFLSFAFNWDDTPEGHDFWKRISEMKDFRVIRFESNYLVSNQKVAIVELAEVEYQNYTLPSGRIPYSCGVNGEMYIIDYNSLLAQEILQKARNEEIVSINTTEFRLKPQSMKGVYQNVYIHKNVKH